MQIVKLAPCSYDLISGYIRRQSDFLGADGARPSSTNNA
jgi:hypothetical protein